MTVIFRLLGVVVCILTLSWKVSAAPVMVEILTDDDYPPYSYVLNGQAKGIYIDIVNRASELLEPKYDVKIVAMPWKRALKKLEMGQNFAVLPPYLHKELRPYIDPYSIPLATEHVATFCRKGIEIQKAFTPALRLPDPISIGLNSGYLILTDKYQKAVEDGNLIVLENKSTEANIMKLLKGRVDCYVNDELSTEYSLALIKNSMDHLPNIEIEKVDILSSQSVHIGYTQVNEENFPYKKDFVEKMDLALRQVIDEMSKNTGE